MASFSRPLTVTKIDNDLWVVEIPFSYESDLPKPESHYETISVDVPDGTLTDFASVPSLFQWIIPKDGAWTQAAVLHDFLYKSHIFTRKLSDEIFLEAMRVLKVPKWKREAMFWAVRIFGTPSWNS